jgi:hypothetical protein
VTSLQAARAIISGFSTSSRTPKKKANSAVVQVVHLEGPLERLGDCHTVPHLRFFFVRNEEAGGSNPLSSTNVFGVRPPVVRKNLADPRIRVNTHSLAAAVALPFSK